MDFPAVEDRPVPYTGMEVFAPHQSVQHCLNGIYCIKGLAFLKHEKYYQLFAEIFSGVYALIKGWVTGNYFFSPRHIVTQQYPENRKKLEMFDRFKGEVIMLHDENNQHRCTGCGICEINCPNGSIEIISRTVIGEDGKKRKDNRQAHLSSWHVHILQFMRENLSVRCPDNRTEI